MDELGELFDLLCHSNTKVLIGVEALKMYRPAVYIPLEEYDVNHFNKHFLTYYCPEQAVLHSSCSHSPQDKTITEFTQMNHFKILHTLEY